MGSPAPPLTVPRRVALGVLALMVTVAGGLALVQASRDSPVFDEGPDIASGVSALVHHDLRANPEHPAPYKAIAALPALLSGPTVPKGPAWDENDWFDYTDDFISAQPDDGLRDLVFLMRLLPIAATLGSGVLIYAMGARLVSRGGGLVSAALWLGSPAVVGYGHVLTPDAAFSFTVLVTAYALLRHVDRPSTRSIVHVALAVGAALCTRHLAIALVPAALVVVGFLWRKDGRREAIDLAIVLLVPVATVWVAYRTLAPSGTSEVVRAQFESIIATAQDKGVVERIALSIPFPLEYRAGLGYLFLVSGPKTVEVLGRTWSGNPFVYLVVMALRTPVAGALLIVASAWGWWRRTVQRSRFLIAVLTPAIALVLVLVGGTLQASARVLLPVYGLLCVAASAVAGARVVERRLLAGGVGFLLVIHLAVGWSSHPDSIAWRTSAFGDVSADRSTDFGQDLYRLGDFAEGREVLVQAASTRGFDMPGDGSLVDARPEEVVGWVAVGRSSLQSYDRQELAWLRPYCHVGEIGGSILLYYFDEPPDRDAPSGDLGGRCPGEVSVRTP